MKVLNRILTEGNKEVKKKKYLNRIRRMQILKF